MSYEVIIDNVDKAEWERYAKGFADYSIYQTRAYQQVRADMDHQEVSRIVIKDGNGDVATMCHVRIKHVIPLGLRIGYVQCGPLFRGKDGKIICSTEALKKLREAYLTHKVNVFRVVPNVCTDEVGRTFAEMLQSAGFTHVKSVEPYRTLVLCMGDSVEKNWGGLSKSFRRNLRKGESVGIQIREGSNKDYCDILEKLYSVLLQRKKFKGLDLKQFVKTQAILSGREKMNIIVAYFDGEPVAAHMVANLGDTGISLLAATNRKGLGSGSSELVWWKSILGASRAGMKRFDLGGIDPDNNPTVYQFKSRMGGKEQFHIGAFEACDNWAIRTIWRMSERVYNLVRK